MGKGYLSLTVAVAAIGGVLFGYDSGVINGVLAMIPFQQTFPWANPAMKGFIVSSLQLGCFLGSLGAGYFCERFGRKRSILAGAICFVIGGTLQASSHGIPQLIVSRIIAGFAVGILSMGVPLYLSEVAPASTRGALVSMQQFAITLGILISFWIDYGSLHIQGNNSWRVPFGIQVGIAGIMALGMLLLPESPRWLMTHGQESRAEANLNRLRDHRAISTGSTAAELSAINESIALERQIGSGKWSELFAHGMWRRTLIGVLIQIFQQLTGINAVMYYASSILAQAGFDTQSTALLATAGSGIVNVVFTLPGLYFIDRVGRRPLLLSGAAVMVTGMVILGVLIAIYGPDFSNSAAPYACLVMMYIFTAGFAFSWGPIGWVYPSEIYPLRIRSKAISLTTASNWLFNFAVSQLVPVLMDAIDWGLYIIFAGFGLIMFIWVFFYVPETKGKSLEEIDLMFGTKSGGFASMAPSLHPASEKSLDVSTEEKA
ncbi:MAG: sugar transporter [Piptocephalis tieghemiana]|nr:MAG: sugar transporter [Piptocephalis tieghemiana]